MDRALMLIVGQEQRGRPVEINHNGSIDVLTFSADGQYLLTVDRDGVQMWGVEDGKQMARMEADEALCVALSQDGRWIAAGGKGYVLLWNTKTYEKLKFPLEGETACGADFSPNSSQLVVAIKGYNGHPNGWYSDHVAETRILNIAAQERLGGQTLDHGDALAAKYSPQGNRVATANGYSIRIWDSNDGRLILDIKDVKATKVLWQSNDHLFVLSCRGGSTIFQQIDASTGIISAEWPADPNSCIAAPKHGNFIVYSTGRTVTIWDVLTRAQLGLIQHTAGVRSIAVSPDSRFLAIGDKDKKITITASILLVALCGPSEQPATIIVRFSFRPHVPEMCHCWLSPLFRYTDEHVVENGWCVLTRWNMP